MRAIMDAPLATSKPGQIGRARDETAEEEPKGTPKSRRPDAQGVGVSA